MGLAWGRQDPGGPHVGTMNLAIRDNHGGWCKNMVNTYDYEDVLCNNHSSFITSSCSKLFDRENSASWKNHSLMYISCICTFLCFVEYNCQSAKCKPCYWIIDKFLFVKYLFGTVENYFSWDIFPFILYFSHWRSSALCFSGHAYSTVAAL